MYLIYPRWVIYITPSSPFSLQRPTAERQTTRDFLLTHRTHSRSLALALVPSPSFPMIQRSPTIDPYATSTSNGSSATRTTSNNNYDDPWTSDSSDESVNKKPPTAPPATSRTRKRQNSLADIAEVDLSSQLDGGEVPWSAGRQFELPVLTTDFVENNATRTFTFIKKTRTRGLLDARRKTQDRLRATTTISFKTIGGRTIRSDVYGVDEEVLTLPLAHDVNDSFLVPAQFLLHSHR